MFLAVFTRAASQASPQPWLWTYNAHPACAVRPQTSQGSQLTFGKPTLVTVVFTAHVRASAQMKTCFNSANSNIFLLSLLSMQISNLSILGLCCVQMFDFKTCCLSKNKPIMLIFSWDWGRIPKAPESNLNMLPPLPTMEVCKVAFSELRIRTSKY